ncbi:MAG: sterol carrier family protein [Micromonosporaceae bacterium]
MPPRQVDPLVLRLAVHTVLQAVDGGSEPAKQPLRDAVRMSLSVLARTVPGKAVEVRVPPYGAVQCEQGPRHTRGQPPNVVETDPVTWVRLVAGHLTWDEAARSGRLRASGIRADLSRHLPLVRPFTESRNDATR